VGLATLPHNVGLNEYVKDLHGKDCDNIELNLLSVCCVGFTLGI